MAALVARSAGIGIQRFSTGIAWAVREMYVVAALLHLSSLQSSVGGPEIIEDDVDEDEMEVFSDSRPMSSAVEDSLDPDMDNPIFIDPKLSSQKKLVERLHATQRTTKVSFSQRVIRRWNAMVRRIRRWRLERKRRRREEQPVEIEMVDGIGDVQEGGVNNDMQEKEEEHHVEVPSRRHHRGCF